MITLNPAKFTIYQDPNWGDWNVKRPNRGMTTGGFRTFERAVGFFNKILPEYDPRTMHAEFRHPGWEYGFTDGPRKTWDRQNEPPDGEGWERNVDAGTGGWERFDYHEESYWRRPITEEAHDG